MVDFALAYVALSARCLGRIRNCGRFWVGLPPFRQFYSKRVPHFGSGGELGFGVSRTPGQAAAFLFLWLDDIIIKRTRGIRVCFSPFDDNFLQRHKTGAESPHDPSSFLESWPRLRPAAWASGGSSSERESWPTIRAWRMEAPKAMAEKRLRKGLERRRRTSRRCNGNLEGPNCGTDVLWSGAQDARQASRVRRYLHARNRD